MTDFADLEVGIHRHDPDYYDVEFRYTPPNSEVEVRLDRNRQGWFQIQLNELRSLKFDPAGYSKLLTARFFADPVVETAFLRATSDAEKEKVPLRVRLMIGLTAPQLHSLIWERLIDPRSGDCISTSENILFSRYLSSMDWRPVRLRPRGKLRALVIVSNPNNLSDYPQMAPVDLKDEMDRAKAGFGFISSSSLPRSPDGAHTAGDRASLKNLVSRLRSESFDILYIVCHGNVAEGGYYLWLEDENGNLDHVSGQDFLARLRDMTELPQLIVLASCESAGDGEGEALTALGPMLAEAGVPAVLAMQGKVSLESITQFMPVMFRTLQEDGQIDRSVAVARGVIRDRPDAWMPVLFMRLKRGRFWYTPGFGGEQGEYTKWVSLVGYIRRQNCTPILGSGLVEPLIGSRREIALSWAKEHNYPLSQYDRESLPRVAQYILRTQSAGHLPNALSDVVRKEITERFPAALEDGLVKDQPWNEDDVVNALHLASRIRWPDVRDDPHFRLAQLRLPIYVTTSPGDLLSDALREVGATPHIRVCPWNELIDLKKIIFDGVPTREEPLVYHLFGHVKVPNSLVFAEDQFFDYLIGVERNKRRIPPAVRKAFVDTALLFLGFHIDDWDLRVFFRVLMAQGGKAALEMRSHAAAQIAPEEGRLLDVSAARNYLVEYFRSENISIYWGSSDDFLTALLQHMGSA